VAVLVIAYGVALIRSTVKLRQACADLEAAGRPMKAAQVIPEPVPEDRNAALLYQRAVATLKELPAPRKDMLDYLGKLAYGFLADDLDANQVDEFEELLKREEVASALSSLEEAMRRPECRFDRDYKAGKLDGRSGSMICDAWQPLPGPGRTTRSKQVVGPRSGTLCGGSSRSPMRWFPTRVWTPSSRVCV